MAQPRPGRKGWRAVLRAFGLVVLAAAAALPVSFFVAMLLTPLLWRLEAALGMELAGHSGPADWILATIFALSTLVLSIILLHWTRDRAAVEAAPDTSSAREPT